MIYLDHAATSPLCAEAREAMMPFLHENFGNPSSLHHLGKAAKYALEVAREQVAALLKARPGEVVFNSGATEGNNHVLKGVTARLRDKGRHIITTQIEHDAVMFPCQSLQRDGWEVTYVGVDNEGIVKLDELEQALAARSDTVLVSVMHANNEMGTLQPIAQIGALCRERKVLFHSDACQTVGHVPLDVTALNVDFLTLSAHKFSGPKGAGALYIRRGARLDTLIDGGHQQKGRRAGTENVAGIVGMGVAADVARQCLQEGEAATVSALREEFERGVEARVEGAFLNGKRDGRVPGICNFSFDGVEGEGLILELDARAGICCSTGSACQAGSLDPSPVLLAIGRPMGLARAGTRFSLGRGTTRDDIMRTLDLLPEVVASLRQLSPQARAQLVGGQTDTAG